MCSVIEGIDNKPTLTISKEESSPRPSVRPDRNLPVLDSEEEATSKVEDETKDNTKIHLEKKNIPWIELIVLKGKPKFSLFHDKMLLCSDP